MNLPRRNLLHRGRTLELFKVREMNIKRWIPLFLLLATWVTDAHSQSGGRESTYETDVMFAYEGPAKDLLIGFMQAPSANVCRDRCLKDQKCQAWIYITEKMSDPKLRRLCGHYAGPAPTSLASKGGQIVSGLVFNRADRQSTYEIDVLYFYEGAAMDRIIDIAQESSPAVCRDLCLKDPYCQVWVYMTDKATVPMLRRMCGRYTGPGSGRRGLPPGQSVSGRISSKGEKAQ